MRRGSAHVVVNVAIVSNAGIPLRGFCLALSLSADRREGVTVMRGGSVSY
jgi:hypothetical protein